MINLWNMFLGYIQISYQKLFWVLLFACIFFVGFFFVTKKRNRRSMPCLAMLSLACSFIFVMTLFSRHVAEYEISLIPFLSYYKAYKVNNTELWLQIIMNIAMYIPIGFALPGCFARMNKLWKVLALVLICSIGIEVIQYIFSIGYSEVDDVMNNLFGTLVGYALYMGFEKCCKKLKKE